MKAKVKPHKLLSLLLALALVVTLLPGMGMTALAAMMAGPSDAFGTVRFVFGESGYGADSTVKLKGYQYITECSPNATPQTVEDEFRREAFITEGNYVAYMYGRRL